MEFTYCRPLALRIAFLPIFVILIGECCTLSEAHDVRLPSTSLVQSRQKRQSSNLRFEILTSKMAGLRKLVDGLEEKLEIQRQQIAKLNETARALRNESQGDWLNKSRLCFRRMTNANDANTTLQNFETRPTSNFTNTAEADEGANTNVVNKTCVTVRCLLLAILKQNSQQAAKQVALAAMLENLKNEIMLLKTDPSPSPTTPAASVPLISTSAATTTSTLKTLEDNETRNYKNCSSHTTYFCDNGNQIFHKQVCDSINDCGDNSDELNCMTGLMTNVSEIKVGMRVRKARYQQGSCRVVGTVKAKRRLGFVVELSDGAEYGHWMSENGMLDLELTNSNQE